MTAQYRMTNPFKDELDITFCENATLIVPQRTKPRRHILAPGCPRAARLWHIPSPSAFHGVMAFNPYDDERDAGTVVHDLGDPQLFGTPVSRGNSDAGKDEEDVSLGVVEGS
jgi:hypothetical protein